MSSPQPKKFDLNMEEDLLEAWNESDGIRELIANDANQGLKNHVAAGGLKKDASNI
jgi:hypothetical protein